MMRFAALVMAVMLMLTSCPKQPQEGQYGFAREIPQEEQAVRMSVVEKAQEYLGFHEEDGSHRKIIDRYNSQEQLPMGYAVQYTDKWCATFGSVVAMETELTHIIPVECGCQRQIELFQTMGSWEEDDAYIPLPGDFIFYHSDHKEAGDCTDWSDHVGIVVGVWENYIKVIEGNCYKAVRYRYILVDDASIRGFGLPDYGNA